MQEEVTRLEQIAMNIRERYSGHASASDMPVSTLTDVVNNATLQPSMQDPQVWRLSTEVCFNTLCFSLPADIH
jgi:hypothetical protein